MQLVCATKDEKRLKSTAISVTPTAKANRGYGRNIDSQKNYNEETQGARYGAEIAISCNKTEFLFYSKTEIFSKSVGVWQWLLTFIFFLLNNLLVLRKYKIY